MLFSASIGIIIWFFSFILSGELAFLFKNIFNYPFTLYSHGLRKLKVHNAYSKKFLSHLCFYLAFTPVPL